MNAEEHRRPPFFGRQREIQELRRRIQKPGLTVVKGRPGIGKSRLLKELVKLLYQEKQTLVGMLEQPGLEGNCLLRAVADAYDHWLADSSWREQKDLLLEMNKGGAVGRVGTTAGEIIGQALPWGAAIKKVFSILRQLDEKLRTGGLSMAPLQADEAKFLLRLIANKKSRPIVLMLNQWEDSHFLDHDFTTLGTFLRNIHSWPSTHVLLHLRCPLRPENVNQDAVKKAEGLARIPPADTLPIDAIDFIDDKKSRTELLAWLKKRFPGTKQIDEDELVSEVIAGNPYVLYKWIYLDEGEQADPATLRKTANDAHEYRSPEIECFLLDLVQKAEQYNERSRQILAAALRLAIIPAPGSTEAWSAVKAAVLGDVDEIEIALFESRDYLRHSADGIPSFGHSTRHETARHLALENERLKPYTRLALEKLVEKLADDSDSSAALAGVGLDSVIRLSLLSQLTSPLVALQSKPISQQLAAAAGMLFRLPWPDAVPVDIDLTTLSASRARLLAAGLFNAFCNAGSDTERAKALLGELRTLHEAHSEDAAVHVELAKGLVNAIAYAGADTERADALLGELRALHEAHSEDAVVRGELVKGLVNAIGRAGANTERVDPLLRELRALHEAHSEDAAVRGILAQGLVNAIAYAGSDTERADPLLRELRALHKAHPEDAFIRTVLDKLQAL